MTGFAIEIYEDLEEQTALGMIQVGDFSERFEIITAYWSADEHRRRWRTALRHLVTHEASAIALMTRMRPQAAPDAIARAWVLYREGERVFVQERLFVPGGPPVTFDEDGLIVNLGPRATRSEDGERISEWQTTVSDIRHFLDAP